MATLVQIEEQIRMAGVKKLSGELVKSTAKYDIYEYIPGQFEIYDKKKKSFLNGKYSSLAEAERMASRIL